MHISVSSMCHMFNLGWFVKTYTGWHNAPERTGHPSGGHHHTSCLGARPESGWNSTLICPANFKEIQGLFMIRKNKQRHKKNEQ